MYSRATHKQLAKKNNVTIIGPATVGGIKPGCFRIGNTGGMLDNIISSKLYVVLVVCFISMFGGSCDFCSDCGCRYRPGSVAYVARSGGMSNEMNNMYALTLMQQHMFNETNTTAFRAIRMVCTKALRSVVIDTPELRFWII